MSEKSSIKKNLAFQTVFQIINTCIPLITSPYLARALGATQQGVFSYSQSIVNYFTLIAMLGVINYGTRTIALCGDDREKRSETFWNIYVFQMVMSLISLSVYILYATLVCKENKIIAILLAFYVLGSFFDISWLWAGIERFDYTAKLSLITRLLSLISILLFVKTPDDLWIYTLIMAGSTFLTAFILWFNIKKVIYFRGIRSISLKKIKSHIKPNIVLFVPLLAMSVYHIMDKTMLGWFSTYDESGYYYNADKIINIPIGIINGVQTVMLPRMTNLVNKDKKVSENTFNLCLEVIIAISVAMAVGIAAVAKEFTPIFFGDGFDACILLIISLSPALIIKSISQTARMQILVPMKKEKILIEAVSWGAIVNLIINLVCIPKLGALGAVIGTVCAELFVCVWQCIKMRKFICFRRTLFKTAIYLAMGVVMLIVVRLVSGSGLNGVVELITEIVFGALVYGLLCVVYWIISKNNILKLLKK